VSPSYGLGLFSLSQVASGQAAIGKRPGGGESDLQMEPDCEGQHPGVQVDLFSAFPFSSKLKKILLVYFSMIWLLNPLQATGYAS